jgi:2-polyprenyl-3-methyl-5-hydroxy-6-metoxy-1,4-benzoquinol methylase
MRPRGSVETSVTSIRTESIEECYLCRAGNGKLLYDDLVDQLFDATGIWRLWQCTTCGLVWLNPRPIAEDLSLIYKTYYTHGEYTRRHLTSFRDRLRSLVLHQVFGYEKKRLPIVPIVVYILGMFSFIREIVEWDTMGLSASERGRLLDVGCGNGEFLNRMMLLGWDVTGVELDDRAARFARKEYGLDVRTSSLEACEFDDRSFDVVVMSHLIEHVYDPIAVLREAWRVLRPGGKVVIVTPNTKSLGHRIFMSHWRGLEVPRHIHIFNPQTMVSLCTKAGFGTHTITSSARSARYLYGPSVMMRAGRKSVGGGGGRGVLLALKSYVFQLVEHIRCRFDKDMGEELFFIGVKQT